jgi:hypothetical protein
VKTARGSRNANRQTGSFRRGRALAPFRRPHETSPTNEEVDSKKKGFISHARVVRPDPIQLKKTPKQKAEILQSRTAARFRVLRSNEPRERTYRALGKSTFIRCRDLGRIQVLEPGNRSKQKLVVDQRRLKQEYETHNLSSQERIEQPGPTLVKGRRSDPYQVPGSGDDR